MFGHVQWKGVALIVLALLFVVGAVQAQETDPGAANGERVAVWLSALSGDHADATLATLFGDDHALKAHLDALEVAFPGFELTVDEVVDGGEQVAVRATFRGVQQGPFAGIPATGHTIEIPVVLFIRLDDGRVTEHWMHGEEADLLQQLETALYAHDLKAVSDHPEHNCTLLPIKHGH